MFPPLEYKKKDFAYFVHTGSPGFSQVPGKPYDSTHWVSTRQVMTTITLHSSAERLW